jgi:malate dehydrogenase
LDLVYNDCVLFCFCPLFILPVGCYDPKRVFGVTTLDIVRAHTFVAAAAGVPVGDVKIPVVGGHAGASILPLLSQAEPKGLKGKLTDAQVGWI